MLNDKRLTIGELNTIEERISEIKELRDTDLPEDVDANLVRELHAYIIRLEESIKAGKRAHLRSVK
jgi:hypothetical protein